MNHKLIWHQTCDDDDNSVWEAFGPYSDGDGGSLADWRLVHKLVNDKPVWVAKHDADLEDVGIWRNEIWPHLSAAQSDIEKLHNEIIEQNQDD